MKPPRTNNMNVVDVITSGHSRTTDFVRYECGCLAIVPMGATRYHHAQSRCAAPDSPAWAADRVDAVTARTGRPRGRAMTPAAAMAARFAAAVNRPAVVTTAEFFRRGAVITDADVMAFDEAIA